jgi:hypothetical protein
MARSLPHYRIADYALFLALHGDPLMTHRLPTNRGSFFERLLTYGPWSVMALLVSCTATPIDLPQPPKEISASQSLTDPPELRRWETQMTTLGRKHCTTLLAGREDFDHRLAGTYYDAEWVYQQIGDYTGDPYWARCAEAAEKIYRDEYVFKNEGRVPGYWNFTHGLTEDYIRTKDERSKRGVGLLARSAAFAADTTPLTETQSSQMSREVAYAIMAYLNAERVGEPRRTRLPLLVSQALGHIQQWFVTKNAPQLKTFMVGLTAHALISYYEKTKDARILPALRTALDGLWAQMWDQQHQAFRYANTSEDKSELDPAADLNLLVAPAYEWLYRKTGDRTLRDRGDAIFAGGVRQAYLQNPKQFNQNYRWSFAYVKLRRMQ